jgi:NitT/TauT family transport system ATP-binding protein
VATAELKSEANQGGPTGIQVNAVEVLFTSSRHPVHALGSVDLSVGEGEFISLLGPTGCGKTTLLRVVGDLISPTRGVVMVRGHDTHVARRNNEFGFVFQEPALLPWRTVLRNVRLPLEVVGYQGDMTARCEELLDLVGLLPFKNHYPHELSGGMKQRVALVRALSWRPSILLMDEPFSAVDELTRNRLQDDLLDLWDLDKKTIIFVTHNITEAVYLSDRVLVFSTRPGRVVADLHVDLERPRRPEMREEPRFIEYIKEGKKALGVYG